MPQWLQLDWETMFVPSRPILEIVIRGSVTYVSLFVLLRLFRRQTGALGPADLLVLLLLADASQNAMANEHHAITDGLILVGTIVIWEYALDWLGYKFPKFGSLLQRQPLSVIHDGKLLHANLDSALMSEDELLSQLRQKGVDDPKYVRQSFIEGDGRLSVITDERCTPQQAQPSDNTGNG